MKKKGCPPKLSADDVAEIKRMYSVREHPWTVTQIARSFKVSTVTVNKAINGTLPVKTRS